MGSFKINPNLVPTMMSELEELFAGAVGNRVVVAMKAHTPVGEDRRRKSGKRRRQGTEREVRVTYMAGTGNKIFALGGYRRFDAESEADQALAYELLKAHVESGRKEGIRDPLAGLRNIQFEPVTRGGLTPAMSRSIRTGTFMRTQKISFKDNPEGSGGKILAGFRKPHQHGTLRRSISIIDVWQEGKKVILEVGNDPQVAPYGRYVEYGLGKGGTKGKREKNAGFMRRTLDSLADDIQDGSLIQGSLLRG